MTSTMFILKNLKSIPRNGIAIFCGLVAEPDDTKGKMKKVSVSFEPLFPIKHGMYLCDNRFHPEDLQKSTQKDKSYGFIICNGDGTTFARISGNQKEILYVIRDPNLPKKHSKGGQSSVRFSRLAKEARQNYLRKVAEHTNKIFIKDDKTIVEGIIVAGSGSLKNQLVQSKIVDPRLLKIVMDTFDTSYGGEIGLNQAIELSCETFLDIQYETEKKIIDSFMNEIVMDSKKYIYGLKDTMEMFENGIVTKLIVWEDLPFYRVLTKDGVLYVKEIDENLSEKVLEKQKLMEYLIDNYQKKNSKLEIITNKTSEGNQFVIGFGGIGGFLSYEVDQNSYENVEIKEEDVKMTFNEDLSEFM